MQLANVKGSKVMELTELVLLWANAGEDKRFPEFLVTDALP